MNSKSEISQTDDSQDHDDTKRFSDDVFKDMEAEIDELLNKLQIDKTKTFLTHDFDEKKKVRIVYLHIDQENMSDYPAFTLKHVPKRKVWESTTTWIRRLLVGEEIVKNYSIYELLRKREYESKGVNPKNSVWEKQVIPPLA